MKATLQQLFIICTFTLLIAPASSGQWVQTNVGLAGGHVHALANNGTNVYAGTTSGGVFLSTNSGSNWTQSDLKLGNILCFAFAGTNIFAGTYGAGVYFSTNNGTNWHHVNSDLSNWPIYSLVAYDTNLFAGSYGKVFLSHDNGNSWIDVTNGIGNWEVDGLTIVGTNVFAGTVEGIYVSSDYGKSWRWTAPPSQVHNVYTFASDGSNILAGSGSDGILLSTDQGDTWKKENIGIPDSNIRFLAVSGTNFYAASYSHGVLISANAGQSWSQVSNGLPNSIVWSLAVTDGEVFAGTDAGVYLSDNNGTTWTEINIGLTNPDVRSLVSDGVNIFAGTWGNGGFLSTNEGSTWTQLGLSKSYVCFDIDNSTIFAGTEAGIYLSTNEGSTWSQSGLSTTNITSLASRGKNVLAAGFNDGPFLSIDEGITWKSVGLAGLGTRALVISDSTLFVGNTFGLYRSSNNGSNWQQNPNFDITTSLAVSGSRIFTSAGSIHSSGVYLSTDTGSTWTQVFNGLTNDLLIVSLLANNGNLFFGTDTGSIYISTNNGTDWAQVSNGLPKAQIFSIAASNAYAIAATQSGIFRRPLSEITKVISVQPIQNPQNYSLQQNYPNPFNPTTMISYHLPVTSFVSLTIYDILGRNVQELFNERQDAGEHSAVFNAGSLSSGVYMYRLRAGAFVSIKKMILMK